MVHLISDEDVWFGLERDNDEIFIILAGEKDWSFNISNPLEFIESVFKFRDNDSLLVCYIKYGYGIIFKKSYFGQLDIRFYQKDELSVEMRLDSDLATKLYGTLTTLKEELENVG